MGRSAVLVSRMCTTRASSRTYVRCTWTVSGETSSSSGSAVSAAVTTCSGAASSNPPASPVTPASASKPATVAFVLVPMSAATDFANPRTGWCFADFSLTRRI